MNDLLPIIALLFAGSLTPGPNNLVVWRQASRAGVAGALPAIAGIVGGGLLLLLLAALGAAPVFAAHPALQRWIAAAGALYLCWLGASLVWGARQASNRRSAANGPARPAGVAALAGFQFLNPKSWVLVLTALAALPAPHAYGGLPWLVLLFSTIPLGCLLLWALFGAALSDAMARDPLRRRADACMGMLMLLGAALLLAR